MSYIDTRRKLLQHLPTIQTLKETGTTAAPINVEIDLSNRCSLGCSWCHFAYTHTRGPLANKTAKPAGWASGGDLIETSLAIDIVRQLAEAGVQSLTVTGGGEPTLHPDFDEIIEYASRRLQVGLYTHGGHITPERAGVLKQACTFVYVSLDAADRDAYKRDKGVDRFNQACEGIRLLGEAEGDAVIGVGFLVTEQNYHQVSQAGFLAKALGADYLQLRPTIHYDQADPSVLAEDTGWLDDALRGIEHELEFRGDFVQADVDRFRMYRDWDGHGYRTCHWAALQTCVTPNGKVWACVNKREHAAAEIGDLTRESFGEVWARRNGVPVTSDCRVMCRGHIPNVALDDMLRPVPHAAFV